MQATYSIVDQRMIKVTLNEGENLFDVRGPTEMFMANPSPGNVIFEEVMARVGRGEVTIEPYIAPPPPPPVSRPPELAAAVFGVGIQNGDIAEIGGTFNIMAAMYFGVGRYALFFVTDLPASYFVTATMAADVEIIEQTTSYVVLEAKDLNGNPIDVPRFDVQVFVVPA